MEKLVKINDVIKTVDKYTNEKDTLTKDIYCILDEIPNAKEGEKDDEVVKAKDVIKILKKNINKAGTLKDDISCILEKIPTKNKEKEIKVNDYVKVINHKEAYITYSEWVLEHIPAKEAVHYSFGFSPDLGGEYKVLFKEKDMLYIGEVYINVLGKCFIINENGVKKIDKKERR